MVERYRPTIELALETYGQDAEDNNYLADVVVDAFHEEARATYGDPLSLGSPGDRRQAA